ncbi:hypothetical protein T01_15599 [Trichinella spiralis]|uniref:Uncharacterized protein n=1 Tax=Trichinella spiralis TaxID=6334 RepID=A0A0V0XL47_TRISP|nr:hypothetical protein T01_15599 [Trichinella spiralis]
MDCQRLIDLQKALQLLTGCMPSLFFQNTIWSFI